MDKQDGIKNDEKNREAWRVNGILVKRWVRCGKSNCRCVSGRRHGGYWYLVWRENGRIRNRYIKRRELDITRAALKRGHEWKREVEKKESEIQIGGGWAYEVLSGRWRVNQEEIEEAVKALRAGLETTVTSRFRGWYAPIRYFKKQLPVLKFCIKLKHPELGVR